MECHWLQQLTAFCKFCHYCLPCITDQQSDEASCNYWDDVCYFVVRQSCSSNMFTLTIQIWLKRRPSMVDMHTDLPMCLPIYCDWFLTSTLTSTCMSLQLHCFCFVTWFLRDSCYCHSPSEDVLWIHSSPCAFLCNVTCWLLQSCLCSVATDHHQQAANGDDRCRLCCQWH